MSAVPNDAPLPGLADPVGDAQRIFRRVLDALAHPGRVVTLDAPAELPAGVLGRGAIGTGLALLDFETAIWLDEVAGVAGPHLRFHCNCPLATSRDQAVFVLIGDPATLPPLDGFALGSDSYPDRSATLVIEVKALDQDGALRLSGPGIEDRAQLGVAGLRTGFWQERAGLAPLFPRGLDLILTCGDRLAAIPRTTTVEE
jgi:alpha-D-ribose 1-methylphosphonate 5-triphosphate synthase subunit PhnH